MKGGFDKPSPYRRKIKSVQFIVIFKKVGLMNQAPTEEKSLQINQTYTEEKLNPFSLLIYSKRWV